MREQVKATPRERLINERVMGRCNHPDFVIELRAYESLRWEAAVCTVCGSSGVCERSRDDDPENPLSWLEWEIERHCADMVMVQRVVRRLERHGWIMTWRRDGAVWEHELRLGNRSARGNRVEDKVESIASAITRAVLEPWFVPLPKDAFPRFKASA